jgi:hypothetical protein
MVSAAWLLRMVEAFDDVRAQVAGTDVEQHWYDWCREARRRLRGGVRDLRNMPGSEELDAHLLPGVASLSWERVKMEYRSGNREDMLEAWRHSCS